MQRLSGMDASFVNLETPDMHLHIMGTVVIDPSTMPGGYAFQRIKDLVAERIHLIPAFRRRLMEVPFGLGNPVWVDDPAFDLDAHVHRIAVPTPHTMHELAEIVGDIASRPVDRRRPLWDLTVVEGLEHGHVALVMKVHHSAVDGVTGADILVQLFDADPAGREVEPEEEWDPKPLPSELELVASSLAGNVVRPGRFARTILRTAGRVVDVVQMQRQKAPTDAPATLPFTAPRTPFTAAITPHRAVAFGHASLDDLKFVKNAFGATVNDVVLAACTESLRHWLIAHDSLPDRALVASVPISVHAETSEEMGTNRVSVMMVSLPVHLEDPVNQLAVIREDTKGAKEIHRALGADVLVALADVAPQQLLNRAIRLYSRMNLADRHQPVHNLIVSNVPGPPIPLYCAGGRVVATFPMGPILEGCALNITVLSNMGNVDFGAIACRESVPDLWDLATGFADAVALLKKAAEEVG